MFKNRKNLTITLVGVGVLLLAAIYFFVIPLIHANAYRTAAADKQPAARTQFEKFEALLDRDVFTKTDAELTTVRADLKASKDVTADTKEALTSYNKHVSSFTELPLLDWNTTYKNTVKLHDAETTFVREGNEAVKEMEAVLAYLDSSADIAAEIEKIESLGDPESLEDLQQTLDKAIATLKKVMPQIDALKAPESLSEQHKIEVAMSKNLLSAMQQVSSALKNLDLAKLEAASTKINTLNTQYDKDMEALNKAFINESKLRKHIDATSDADKEQKKFVEA